MKQLILIRHAKSSWDFPELSDHDRPLNRRGEKAAPLMGRVLAERGIQLDLMLSSTAVRALVTAQIIAREIGFLSNDIIEQRRIYHASSRELMEVVLGIDSSIESVALFGHNPGFEDFADLLIDDGGPGHIATAAVVRIEFDVERWADVEPGSGRLVEHLYPKMFG